MTCRQLVQAAKEHLEENGIHDAGSDIWLLLEAAGMDRQTWLLQADAEADPELVRRFLAFLERRCRREPVQYILGEAWLYGRRFCVTPDVLIPRPDTEILIGEAMKRLQDGMRILDLCTGSGCILLSLLGRGGVTGCGSDLSEAALAVARENGRRLGLEAQWVCSDLFADVTGPFDIIVSNPPYIASDVLPALEPEVRLHEPVMALDGGPDGLGLLRRIIRDAGRYLQKDGWLLLEIGYDQGRSVPALLQAAGYRQISVVRDFAGHDRVAIGRI